MTQTFNTKRALKAVPKPPVLEPRKPSWSLLTEPGRYVNSASTDIRKTFERWRNQL